MPTTDLRGHTVPTRPEAPTLQGWVLDPLLSVRDPIPVANVTARTQKLVDLAALSPSITPSTSNPVFVFRADAGAGRELEYTTGGGVWVTVPAEDDTGWQNLTLQNGWIAYTNTAYQAPRYRRLNKVVHVELAIEGGTVAPGTVITALPVGCRPAAYLVATLWANGVARPVEIAPGGNVVVGDTAISNLRTIGTFSFPADQ